MRSLGVTVGRRVYIDTDGREIPEVQRRALGVVARADGLPPLVVADGLRSCFRGAMRPRLEEVTGGDPFEPGRVRLGSVDQRTYFDVEYGFPARRLHDEDFRDWVYARTLVDSGLELADANAESARLFDDDPLDDGTAAETGESERGVACYESGLVDCYLAGRLGLLVRDPREISQRLLPRPAIEPKVLERGPVDLTRFFVGYLLDEADVTPAMPRWAWSLSMPRWLALATVDSGHAAAVKAELFRRARDPERDIWTRMRMVSMLTTLLDAVRAPRGEWPRDPFDDMGEASTECALAVLANQNWTMEEAHERCVVRQRKVDEALQFDILSPRILRMRREACVEPPCLDALADVTTPGAGGPDESPPGRATAFR